jgi:uncharacterized membrane protein
MESRRGVVHPQTLQKKVSTMTTLKTGASLASAAALFALSTAAFAAAPPKGSSGLAVAASDKVHCYGVHECKGNADCKTTENSCKGQNTCKGHSFKAVAATECLTKGGIIGDLVAKK